MSNQTSRSKNLIVNPRFEEINTDTMFPKKWNTGTISKSLAPEFRLDQKTFFCGRACVSLIATGKVGCYGWWSQTVKGVKGGEYYRFSAHYLTKGIKTQDNCSEAVLTWLDKNGKSLGYTYADEYSAGTGWSQCLRVIKAPKKAEAIDIRLGLKWAKKGGIWWNNVAIVQVIPPKKRTVKVATTHGCPGKPSTSKENRDYFCKLLDRAGQQKVDIACLTEAINKVDIPKPYEIIAERIPGETTDRLSEKARCYDMYVIAGIIERGDDNNIHNTGVLIGRKGEIGGIYRKTHLPRNEILGAIVPGNKFPVFETDFGKIGIMICMDYQISEVARILTLKGAEMLFVPIVGDIRPVGVNSQWARTAWEIVPRVRAIDNGVFLITSGSNIPSLIVDPLGKILAVNGENLGVVTAKLHLNGESNLRCRWDVVSGEGEARRVYFHDRRPGIYNDIIAVEK